MALAVVSRVHFSSYRVPGCAGMDETNAGLLGLPRDFICASVCRRSLACRIPSGAFQQWSEGLSVPEHVCGICIRGSPFPAIAKAQAGARNESHELTDHVELPAHSY